MQPEIHQGTARHPIERRAGALLSLMLLVTVCQRCARDRHQVTPGTLGTDLKRMPRGQMTPFPWPGVDLARTTPQPGRWEGPKTDPKAEMASGKVDVRSSVPLTGNCHDL